MVSITLNINFMGGNIFVEAFRNWIRVGVCSFDSLRNSNISDGTSGQWKTGGSHLNLGMKIYVAI